MKKAHKTEPSPRTHAQYGNCRPLSLSLCFSFSACLDCICGCVSGIHISTDGGNKTYFGQVQDASFANRCYVKLNTEFHYVDIFESHYYLFQFKCLFFLFAECFCSIVFQPHHNHAIQRTPRYIHRVFWCWYLLSVVGFSVYDLYCVLSTLECCCSMNYRARELVHSKRTKNSPNVKISEHNSALFPYFFYVDTIHHCRIGKMCARKQTFVLNYKVTY